MSIRRDSALMAQRNPTVQLPWLPVVFWLGGTLAGLVFFVNRWEVLTPMGWKPGNPQPGHLMVELRTIVDLVIGGGMLGGWYARNARYGDARWNLVSAALFLIWTGLGLAGWLPAKLFGAGCVVWLITGFWLMWKHRDQGDKATDFLWKPRSWDLFFFTLFVLLSTAADAVLLPHAPPSRIAAADFVLGRFLTHFYRAITIWFLLAWHDRWVPTAVRWVGWTMLALVPLFLTADILLKLTWSKGLMMLFAELEVAGKFDVRRALEGGGVTITPVTVVLAALAVVAALAIYWLCLRGSRRMGWRISPLGLLGCGVLSWGMLQVEQGLGVAIKSRAWRWWEAKSAPMRFTPFSPDPGLAVFHADLRDARPTAPSTVVLKAKPDVYLFIVETLRSDALNPQTAPFLSHWRDAECQPLGETFSASNATHLSWFSLLSGRLPIFWEEGRREGKLSPLLETLRSGGYKLEVRTVMDLNYFQMLPTNFGAGDELGHLEFVDSHSADHVLDPPEREIKMMAHLQDAIQGAPVGGVFRLTALDSPHYPYRWPKSFTPPWNNFDENLLFPLHPTAEQVEQVRRRYLNSVAWVDHVMADFIAKLKAAGRYEDALIILTGDHGEEFQEYGNWFHFSALSPEQTRVPILIKWPKATGRGPTFSAACHLDLAPTLLDGLGFPKESWENLIGRSLLRADGKPRTIVLATHLASRNGEGLLLRREHMAAAFGWPKVWEAGVPTTLWLERSSGLGILPSTAQSQDYVKALKSSFPDVWDRVFTRLDPVSGQ